MKKVFLVVVFTLLMCLGARAQVIILNENIFQGRMSEIKATVLDSLSNEPVAFASVYVIPAKDTIITNFTLSNDKGEAKLEEVPYGNYFFHVEMMGYKPFVKERYFRERQEDMGIIRLQQDEQFLQAAVVSDIGNPIVVKQDTVEFNASSFRVGANAMLKDLLQRMPGMEITEDGKVKFNGEEIDKLTVGGRTFFFKDQSTALNNLPAAVVDKIRVIDRESENTRATGIQDGTREKVLDVGLKKEYEQGWFGNVGLKGGTTLGKKDSDDALRDNRGFLYSGNALVSAYTEKDQVTLIGNVQNINDTGIVMVYMDDEGERNTLGQGLSSAAQLGVNANTTRIKDVESTVSVNYKYADIDSGTRSNRTTYQDDGNMGSSAENTGKQYANSLSANMEFEKENGDVWFHIRPSFSFRKNEEYVADTTETYRNGTFLNSSGNSSRSYSVGKYADLDADVTFQNLWGKSKRSLRLNAAASYDTDNGDRQETSLLTTSAGKDSRVMQYKSTAISPMLVGGLRYTEPVGQKWTLSAMAALTWSERNKLRDAFDAAGRNDYYSSETRIHYWKQETDLTVQYQLGTTSWLTLGGRLMGILNENYSKSFGIEETTGKGEWNWYVSPTLRFQHIQGNDRLMVSASGYSPQPNSSKMLPTLDISNPSRLTLGNVYLKPYSYTFFSAGWTRNNREKFSTLMVSLYGQAMFKPIVSALWYDPDGILYSIPVNTAKPSLTASLNMTYTTPLDAGKLWSVTFSGLASYASSVSYQARTALAALDKDAFDYSAFMADFWGSEEGNRFYGGASGFSESRTRSFTPYAQFTVKFNPVHYSLSARVYLQGHIARYSLDPKANLNTLDTGIAARASYTTPHQFELNSDLTYVFYTGYAEGYGLPEWQWNAEISKNLGAFNLSIKVNDILNQTRNLTHTVTDNYEEDMYRLSMGRYILFGVKWNFGKMNAAHSQRAQQAAWNMVL